RAPTYTRLPSTTLYRSAVDLVDAAAGGIRLARACAGGRQAHVRPRVEAAFAEYSARGPYPGRGQAHVGIGQQGVADQLLQHRVVEVRPPLRNRDAGGEGFLRGIAQGHLRRYRRAVVGAGGAGRQHGGGHGQAEGPDHHGSSSSKWKKRPLGASSPASASRTLVRAPSGMSSSPSPLFMSVRT